MKTNHENYDLFSSQERTLEECERFLDYVSKLYPNTGLITLSPEDLRGMAMAFGIFRAMTGKVLDIKKLEVMGCNIPIVSHSSLQPDEFVLVNESGGLILRGKIKSVINQE